MIILLKLLKYLYDDTSSTIRVELFIRRQQWSQNTIPKPNSAVDSLSHYTNLQPNIKILLKLFVISSYFFYSGKKFSALNRLKNYLRNTMSVNRLNGLAMANINKKEQFDESEIITEFARNSPKRMQLSEWIK
jgi:alpha-glucuronidase